MTAREAVEKDIPEILALLGRFHAQAGLGAPLDPRSLEHTVRGLMRAELAHVLVSGSGTACVVATPLWFNHGWVDAVEQWWWDEGGEGIALLKAMEAWASKWSPVTITIGTIETINPEGREKAYRRLGYEPKDRTYIKRLR